MSENTTDKLADLISKRHKCLLQLCALGRKQAELIAKGDMGQLLRLLGAKNRLIVAVQAIEQGLAPFHAQDPKDRSWPTEEAHAKCADQAELCRQLLEEVMQLEQQNEKQMTLRRDQIANQLQAAQAAGRARSAYQVQQKRGVLQGPHAQAFDDSAPEGQAKLDLHSEA